MKNYDSCYKAYDIRSIYQEPLDSSFAYSLGKGIGQHLVKKVWPDATFVFGADVREANNELIYWFLKGLEDGWIQDYIWVGLPVESLDEQVQFRWVCSSSMLYYFAGGSFDMWMVFTASHNPPEYVGMKIVDEHWHLIPSWDLKDMVDQYDEVWDIDDAELKRIREKAMGPENSLWEIVDEKLEALTHMLSADFAKLKRPLKLVVDFSNGSAISYEKWFLEALQESDGYEFVFLDDKADSTFSSHESDTTNPHDYAKLMAAVLEHQADFGIMFDGDADRLWFVNEKWEFVSGDLLVAVMAKNILRDAEPWEAVVYDVTSTNTIPEIVQRMWGVPIPSRVGHRHIKEKMVKHNAIYGGELSGHLFFPKVWSVEFPLLALYHVLSEMEWYATFSDMIADICVYYKPPLVNYKVDDKDGCLEAIKEIYKDHEQDLTDGVRVNLSDGWFLARKSNTEPKIRIYVEWENKIWCDEKLKEIEEILKKF